MSKESISSKQLVEHYGSIDAVATAFGVSQGTVRKWISGGIPKSRQAQANRLLAEKLPAKHAKADTTTPQSQKDDVSTQNISPMISSNASSDDAHADTITTYRKRGNFGVLLVGSLTTLAAVTSLSILLILFFAPEMIPALKTAQTVSVSEYYEAREQQAQQNIRDLRQQVSNLQSDINELQTRSQTTESVLKEVGQQDRSRAIEQLMDALVTLEGRVSSLDNVLVDERSETRELSTLIHQASQAYKSDNTADVTRALTLETLADAIQDSQSFETELLAAKALFKDDAEMQSTLQSLRPMAKKGVVSVNWLLDEFDYVTSEMMKSAQQHPTGDPGIFDKMIALVGRYISIRKKDQDMIAGMGKNAAQKIQDTLRNNDWQSAQRMMQELGAQSKANVETLVTATEQRMIAEKMADILRKRARDIVEAPASEQNGNMF